MHNLGLIFPATIFNDDKYFLSRSTKLSNINENDNIILMFYSKQTYMNGFFSHYMESKEEMEKCLTGLSKYVNMK